MIRDRLKNVARKAAIKFFNMEFDTEEEAAPRPRRVDPASFDASKIPKIVDGDGDTPGPNHREDIGRTWTAAQLVGGAPPFFLDMRPESEKSRGSLPGALHLPGRSVEQHLNRLPADKSLRVIVYDQDGESGSTELAAWLRSNGVPMARRLKGGFAEWVQNGEPIVT
jgi:rhodanese-related sulfurtransferase